MCSNPDNQTKSEIRDGMRIDWDAPIPMDDGIILRADVFRPVEEGRYPVLLTYGLIVAAIAVLWTVLGKTHPSHTAAAGGHAADAGAMREVLGMRDIRVIAIALASGMWVFQLYSAFLPEFFQTVRGLTLEQAGSLTALVPFSGVFAAAGAGAWSVDGMLQNKKVAYAH